jgi:hypothetical protein
MSIGAFWLSRQFIAPMSLLLDRLGHGLTYGDSIPAAIAMGIMDSNGRALCAALGAVIVMLSVPSARPHRWAYLVVLLYAVAAQPRFRWYTPPTTWDKVSEIANILWPALVCVVTAMLLLRSRRNSAVARSGEVAKT